MNAISPTQLIHEFANPNRTIYDILYLYGSPDKTASLVASLKQEVQNRNPIATIIHTTGYAFCNDTILHYRQGVQSKICNDYRGDLLIFEDIQFVAGKITAEQELYGIIDGYLENNRKIVITGEIPFNCIHCLAPRIQAQIAGGLNLKIE